MSGEDQRFDVSQQSWADDIKELAVQKYAADNYRRLLDEGDHAYAELKEAAGEWKTRYSNAMDVNADLRAKLAERSAEYLAAHITYDKGYQAGRQDAEDAKEDEDEVLAETARYRAEVERLNAKLAEVGTAFEKSEDHYQALLRVAINALMDMDNGLVVHEGHWHTRQHVAIVKIKECLK